MTHGECDYPFNTLRPRQNGRHIADDILKCIFLNENVWIPIKISLKFVPKGPINNIPALVQIMAWCRPGNKPLSEPMMVRLPTHICIAWPQWVKIYKHLWYIYIMWITKPSTPNEYDYSDDKSILVEVTAWCYQATSYYHSHRWNLNYFDDYLKSKLL